MSDTTTTPVMPKFNFAVTVDDKAVKAAQDARGGDWIKPGKQTLSILKVEYKGHPAKDSTWLKFNLTLGKADTKPEADGKFKGAIYHNVMVPTQDIVYDGKLNVFGMLSSFMAGLGVALTASNVAEVITKYFANFEGLTGMTLEVDLGYNGVHVVRENDLFYVVDKAKKRVPLSTGNEFDSKDAALGQAIVDGFGGPDGYGIKKRLEVLRVHPGALQEPVSKTPPKTKKPVVVFDE